MTTLKITKVNQQFDLTVAGSVPFF